MPVLAEAGIGIAQAFGPVTDDAVRATDVVVLLADLLTPADTR